MPRLRISPKLLIIISLAVVLSGCMGGKKDITQKAPTPVTPCIVISPDLPLRIAGLDAEDIKDPLSELFVDDFKSPAAADMMKSYELNCWWGKNVGEKREYYYCGGKYRAPELDVSGNIKRHVDKNFKIGFLVEDPHFIRVKTVEASCFLPQ